MSAKDYEIILCKDGHLYINFRDGKEIRSKDSKMLSEDDIAEIKKWFKKQSVSEDDALDLEIRRFLREVHDRDTTISDVARYFAQWQKNRDEKEINEVRITEYERGLQHGKDEAKRQYEEKCLENAKLYNKDYPNDVVTKVFGAGNLESWEYDEAEKVFGYACEVAKEQLMKDAVDGWLECNERRDMSVFFVSDHFDSTDAPVADYNIGDKVKLIVIKEK